MVDDAKGLVTALTEQLRNNDIGEIDRTQQHNAATSSTSATTFDATLARNAGNTGNSSSDINNNFYDHVEESFPLPDFLAESQVRAALHHAINAHYSRKKLSATRHHLFPSFRICDLLCWGARPWMTDVDGP